MKLSLQLAIPILIASISPLIIMGADNIAKKAALETFKKAYLENNVAVVQTMLNKGDVTSEEVGSYAADYYCNKNDACTRAIAAKNPYAIWDAHYTPDSWHYPFFEEENLKNFLQQGFIVPFINQNRTNIGIVPKGLYGLGNIPVLQYYAVIRPIVQRNPRVLGGPQIDLITLLLENGANPHYEASSELSNYLLPEEQWDTKVNTYFFLKSLTKKEEGPALETLFNKYARNPDAKGAYNTTDMFYPGSRFDRPVKTKEEQK